MLKIFIIILLVFINADAKPSVDACVKKLKNSSDALVFCYRNVADQYREGKMTRRDTAKALELYKKACDAGDGLTCELLGNTYEVGNGILVGKRGTVDVKRDWKLSYEFYKKACDSKHRRCFELKFAKLRYENEKICLEDNNGTACKLAGDKTKSKYKDIRFDFYNKGCTLGDSISCLKAAELSRKDSEKLYKKACDLKNNMGCFNYAGKLINKDQKNLKIYIAMMKKGCNSEFAPACSELGNFYIRNKKYRIAKEYYGLGCDLEDQRSCNTYNNWRYDKR